LVIYHSLKASFCEHVLEEELSIIWLQR